MVNVLERMVDRTKEIGLVDGFVIVMDCIVLVIVMDCILCLTTTITVS